MRIYRVKRGVGIGGVITNVSGTGPYDLTLNTGDVLTAVTPTGDTPTTGYLILYGFGNTDTDLVAEQEPVCINNTDMATYFERANN